MADSCYEINFKIQNKKNQITYYMNTNQWGVFFDNTLIPTFNPNTLDFSTVPDQWVTCTQVIQDTIWHDITLYYTPDANYTHMYVGYVGNPANAIQNNWSSSGSVGFYVWWDEISVTKIPCIPCPITIGSTSSTDNMCGNSDGTITVSATPAGLTYTLINAGTGATIGTNSTGAFTGLIGGNYYVEVSDGTCMEQTGVITVTDVGVPADPGTNGTASFCTSDASANLFFSLNGSPDPGGVWTPTLTSGSGVFDPSVDAAGTYTYTVTNACGPETAEVVVSVTQSADATITSPGVLCVSSGAINLSAADPGGIWGGTGITDINTGTFDPAVAGAGNHIITYTIGGACGNSGAEVIIVSAGDDAAFTYAPTTFCLSDTDPVPTVTGLAGGTFSIDGTGVIDGSTGEIDLDASGIGTYTVTYATNGPCPSSSTFDIEISNTSDATIAAAGPFCEMDDAVTLVAATSGGTWSGTGVNATSGMFDPETAGPGTWQIIYEIPGACGDSDTITIVVNPLPTVDAGSDVVISAGASVGLTGSGGATYVWDPPTYLSCTDCQTTIATPPVTMTYTLTATDSNGCINTDFVTVGISVEPEDIFVPNIFSPNGDNNNDFFVVEGSGLSQFDMKIFNRWGELVFSSDDQNVSWDGTQNGQALNTGVFAYVLTYVDNFGVKQVVSGNVTLLK